MADSSYASWARLKWRNEPTLRFQLVPVCGLSLAWLRVSLYISNFGLSTVYGFKLLRSTYCGPTTAQVRAKLVEEWPVVQTDLDLLCQLQRWWFDSLQRLWRIVSRAVSIWWNQDGCSCQGNWNADGNDSTMNIWQSIFTESCSELIRYGMSIVSWKQVAFSPSNLFHFGPFLTSKLAVPESLFDPQVNGEVLGTVTSQFIRYSFDLPSLKGLNRLEVGAWTNVDDIQRADVDVDTGLFHVYSLCSFIWSAYFWSQQFLFFRMIVSAFQVVFDHSILVGGRFMASSGGWDWAPYTNTQQEGARTFTYGIWKHVYLVYTPSNSASIIHVVPQIYYQGRYPTKALVDGQHAGFKVKVKVFLSAKSPTNGSLTLQNSWNGEIALGFAMLPAGNSSAILEVNASAKEISLWWPIGMGDQPLYDVTVTFSPNSSPSSGVSTHRKVGFRYFALVTGNDTDPAYVARAAQEQGTESHGMYFRINGAAFWSKGAIDAVKGGNSCEYFSPFFILHCSMSVRRVNSTCNMRAFAGIRNQVPTSSRWKTWKVALAVKHIESWCVQLLMEAQCRVKCWRDGGTGAMMARPQHSSRLGGWHFHARRVLRSLWWAGTHCDLARIRSVIPSTLWP